MTRTLPVSSGDDALAAAEILALEQVEETLFRSWRNQDNRANAIFGGQPLAQALAAAARTVPGWPAHNLTANFMRSGNCDAPVDYRVEILRDGRRFAARRVLASQDGKAIFDCLCSFHDPEESVHHQGVGMDDVPGPETLVSMAAFLEAHGDRLPEVMRRSLGLPFPVEIRMVDPLTSFGGRKEAVRDFWFRIATAADLPDPRDHQCMLAFASDYWLPGAAAIPHPPSEKYALGVTSLNHAIWFHAPVRADQWLLYRTSSPWSGQGRGLAHGQIFDLGGQLVASTSQEASLRQFAKPQGA